MLSILFGLLSALTWGAGDFAGGLSSRVIGPYRAVMLGEAVGLVLLLGTVGILREPLPAPQVLLYAASAGVVGCLGLLILYRSLATGQMSLAAPVSALLAAALPLLVSAFVEGLPGTLQLIGFAFALGAIWFISQGEDGFHMQRLADLRLPFLSGVGFGLYFILTHHATQSSILWPLIASRFAGTTLLVIFLLARREHMGAPRSAWKLIGLNALSEMAGNTFYILAGQAGRLDVAAVLSSLYPGSTVILAWLVLKERIVRAQVLGIWAALIAIVLMTI